MSDGDHVPFRFDLDGAPRASAGARWLWLAALLLPPASAQDLPAARDGAAPPPPVRAPAAPAGTDDPADADDTSGDAPSDAADPARDDHRELAARRLLHAAGGGVLRGTSRWAVDHWDIQRDGRWEQLPPGTITDAVREDAVLAEAGRRQAAVRRADPARRVEVAHWMLEQGLLTESLKLLDDVLLHDPDQLEALALLGRDDLPIGLPRLDVPAADLPAARTQFLQWGGNAPPALREVAVHQLANLAEQEPLRADLQQQLAGPSAGGRAFAALALRRLVAPGQASQAEVEELLRRAVRDVAPDVRRQASLALRTNGEPAVILPVVGALASRSSAVRSNAAESLGLMGYRAAVEPLVNRLATLSPGAGEFRPRANVFVGNQIAYVAGFNVEVANNAAIAEPEIGVLQEGATLDVTVLGASTSTYATESRALTTALQRLTGAQPGDSKSAWEAWWNKNSAEWQ